MPNIQTDEQQSAHDILLSVWDREMSADEAFEELGFDDPGRTGEEVAGHRCERLRIALQMLYDVQNGPPLERNRAEWEAAMCWAVSALRDATERDEEVVR